jgi:glycosyltransferase involved in cell wall biosynthesis
MRETLEKLAAELELTNVRFAGYLSEDELRAAVAGALAVVVPSDAYETFGYTVYEAMAAGRPVIASRLGPLPELVTHGETGLLFTPGDASSLAEEIRRMRSDPAAAHRMGAAGRAGFEARNDLDLHYETLLQVYREVAREHTGLTPPTRVGAEMIR